MSGVLACIAAVLGGGIVQPSNWTIKLTAILVVRVKGKLGREKMKVMGRGKEKKTFLSSTILCEIIFGTK